MQRNYWHGREFSIERSWLEEACGAMGVVAEVQLAVVSFRGPVEGRLNGWRYGGWHVSVSRELSAEEATFCLLHELVHVRQAEAAGGWSAFLARRHRELVAARIRGPRQRRWFIDAAYRRLPSEREADALAWRYLPSLGCFAER